jgi:tetratricopeptide (TPR) repeat protein
VRHPRTPAGRAARRRVVVGRALVAAAILLVLLLSGCQLVRDMCMRSCTEARYLAEQARQAEQADNLPRAVELMSQALETNPGDPQLHREMARLMIDTGNRPAAVEHLQYVTEKLPDDSESFVLLAKLLLEQGRTGEATAAADAALSADPLDTTALVMRAALAQRQADSDLALETYYRVLAVEPRHIEARLRVAEIQLDRRRPEIAASMLRAVCQSPHADPNQSAEAGWVLGIAYGQGQRWDEAVTALADAAALRADRMNADDWYRLAYARHQTGDVERSRDDLRQALRLDPRHPKAQAMAEELRQQRGGVIRIGHTDPPIPAPQYW